MPFKFIIFLFYSLIVNSNPSGIIDCDAKQLLKIHVTQKCNRYAVFGNL